MSATNQFNGLTMPVFTAFGWAGEETAIQFALSQLDYRALSNRFFRIVALI